MAEASRPSVSCWNWKMLLFYENLCARWYHRIPTETILNLSGVSLVYIDMNLYNKTADEL